MNVFASDLEKYYKISFQAWRPSFGDKLSLWVNHFGLHCVAMYRFGQFASRLYHKNIIFGILPIAIHSVLNYIIHLVYQVDIDAATIGPGLYIGHIGCIYIGKSNVGENFSVTHNVTIGVGHSAGKEGRPTIGDNVWVGTGSTLAGSIAIGNKVTIAPNTFLSRSIPDGCLVGGNPGKILAQNYDNSKLFGGLGTNPRNATLSDQ